MEWEKSKSAGITIEWKTRHNPGEQGGLGGR